MAETLSFGQIFFKIGDEGMGGGFRVWAGNSRDRELVMIGVFPSSVGGTMICIVMEALGGAAQRPATVNSSC